MKQIAPRTLISAVITAPLAFITVASMTLVGGLGACQSSSKGTGSSTTGSSNTGPSNTGSMGIVNARCPMKPDCGKAPSAASSVSFKGERVGFCCPGCIGEWNEMSDAQKSERLAKVR